VAQELMARGWKDVRPLKGGFDAWQQAGYPTEPKRDRIPVAQAAENLRKTEGDDSSDI
jgi:3-mercaptopyruvate sulfurtransferase SseA